MENAIKRVNLRSECWKQRCTTLYNPSVQKKYLQKDSKAIKSEARSGDIEIINNCAVDHPMKQESDSVQSMASWVKRFRTLKKNTRKSR